MGVIGGIGRLFKPRVARSAAEGDPRVAEGLQLVEAGDLAKAEKLANRLLAAEPGHAEALGLLGRIDVQRRRFDPAIRHLTKAVQLDPARSSLRQGLAIAQASAGQFPAAIATLREAIALDPQDVAAHNNLGNCYQHQGDLAAAEDCYRRAIALDRQHVGAWVNLAGLQRQQGDYAAAIETCRKALRARENDDAPELHYHLAIALENADRWEDTVQELRKVVELRPDYPGAHMELGMVLAKLGRTTEALASYREEIARQPNLALAHNGLGFVLLTQNDIEGALTCFRKVLSLQPDFAAVHSNLLGAQNYQAGWRQKRFYQEALQFDARQARRFMPKVLRFANVPDRARVLKVGYVSPDFREHSVAHFIRRLLGAHNREQVEVYAYSDVARPDAFTRGFEAQADHWRSIVGTTDEALAGQVRDDGIDILVDLTGHTSGNRLLAFARKPAPVQVSWLGYPNTTGMRAMDYRLTDAVADPPEARDNFHTEKLVRLPTGFLCYQPDEAVPEVAPPPCLARGHVTLGSFNTTKKVTDETVGLWARILEALPDARLLLKSDSLSDEVARQRLLARFREQGIAAERLEMDGWVLATKEHLASYSRVDVALDPFPYNGTTTTCEALWMGVPVVTLRGDRHAGRVGASILTHAGLPELVADDVDGYLERVRTLALDSARLAALRESLRDRMRASPLMDLPAFTDALEDAYRQMWTSWCDGQRKR